MERRTALYNNYRNGRFNPLGLNGGIYYTREYHSHYHRQIYYIPSNAICDTSANGKICGNENGEFTIRPTTAPLQYIKDPGLHGSNDKDVDEQAAKLGAVSLTDRDEHVGITGRGAIAPTNSQLKPTGHFTSFKSTRITSPDTSTNRQRIRINEDQAKYLEEPVTDSDECESGRKHRPLPSECYPQQSKYGFKIDNVHIDQCIDQNDQDEKKGGQKLKEPPEITTVDLNIRSNTLEHHTYKYEICRDVYIDDLTKERCSGQLVIRRGQLFKITLILNRPYKYGDNFKIIAKAGKTPLRSKGTYVTVATDATSDEDGWSARILQAKQYKVTIGVLCSALCFVGKWTFEFETMTTGLDDVCSAKSQMEKACIYILFNAWCKEDPVYLENAEQREEYVLNDSGKLYVGNYWQIFGRPWNFGQFESISLECALWILDNKCFLSTAARGNPIPVTRRISALVNECDDRGILIGKWGDSYPDGIPPTRWTGSVAILQEFMETGKPVRYGQCWVFSGVTTTICRALGIPCRSVSNFVSAHDKDGSLTIDVHWDENYQLMPELDTDTVWNYHVWNEVWMTRPDLKPEYNGWQVIDATPQDTNGDIHCVGPAPVEAIKQGDTSTLYDTPFVFAEVNSDRVHWFKQPDGSYRTSYECDVIGKNISTKAIGRCKDFSNKDRIPDREDITHNYKYREGSRKERAAVRRACRLANKPAVDQDNGKEDIKIRSIDIDDVYIGSSFELPIQLENVSNEKRTVSLSVTLSSVYYTGVTRKQLKNETFKKVIDPHSGITLTMRIDTSEYLDDIVDFNYAMKINYLASVEETQQIYASQDDFRLRTIIPEVKTTKSTVKKGEKFMVKVSFRNPLSRPLTGCIFNFEAAGNLKPTTIEASDVPAGGVAETECEVIAQRVGDCVVITGFECRELGDLQGQCSVVVKD